MGNKAVSQVALRDISKYANVEREKRRSNQLEHEKDSLDESWIVSRDYLQTKTTTRLNRLLGLHKVNKVNKLQK